MIRGVVFDMDGVLFDTEVIYDEAWRRAAKQLNTPDIEPAIRDCKGTNDADTRVYFLKNYPEMDFEAFDQAQRAAFEYIVETNGLPEKTGVHEILRMLKQRKVPLALASSTGRARIMSHLKRAGIEDVFDVIVAGDEITKGKPDPEIYLKACAALGLDPADCAAVEDSFHGIRSAHAAGMRAAMVPDLVQPTEEIRALTWKVLPTLNELCAVLAEELDG